MTYRDTVYLKKATEIKSEYLTSIFNENGRAFDKV